MATKTRLIIEGDLVIREDVETCPDGERISRKRTKLEDWEAQLRAQQGAMEFLPPVSCGWVVAKKDKGNRSCVVVQLPPGIHKWVYSEERRMYTTSFPYIILAINFIRGAIDGASSANRCGVFVYYRNESVATLDDPLFFPNMPNVYEDGALCWGTERIPLDAPINRKVEMVADAFFRSNFNHHELGYHWIPSKDGIRGHPQTFEDWENRSREDPGFVLRLAWRPAGVTVRQVLDWWVQ